MRKMKNYIVSITTNKTEMNINVEALNKNEAKDKIVDVLKRCNLFGHKSLNDFKLNCKRIRGKNNGRNGLFCTRSC